MNVFDGTSPPRTWLITGCSSGFGRHLAAAALARGDRVAVTARDVSKIQDLVGGYPHSAIAHRLDVTDRASIDSALDAGLTAFGSLDILVNNAGYGLMGAIEEVSDAQVRKLFDTNVFGVIDVIRAVLPIFRKQASGRILNVTSNGGRFSLPGLGAYHGTKFAVEGISEALAQELAPLGIKLTIVEPGGFSTDFEKRSLAVAQPQPQYQFVRSYLENLGRDYVRGDPADAAQAMLNIADLSDPPLRVALGPHVAQHLMEKLLGDVESYRQHESLWLSTARQSLR